MKLKLKEMTKKGFFIHHFNIVVQSMAGVHMIYMYVYTDRLTSVGLLRNWHDGHLDNTFELRPK